MPITQFGARRFAWGERTYVMGIINCTPDSFSGDGIGTDLPAGVKLAEQMTGDGADIIDIGGESTRPGAHPVSVATEIERVIPLLQALSADPALKQSVYSIDTTKAEVAAVALQAGAHIVNDISGLKQDPEIADIVAEHRAGLVLVHHPEHASDSDLISEMVRWLAAQIDLAVRKGIQLERIIVDPGIGFGKSRQQNLVILRNLHMLAVLGRPILLGTSRKGTLGWLLRGRPPEQRLEATAATVALGIAAGVDIVRVHDVAKMVLVARTSDAIIRGQLPD